MRGCTGRQDAAAAVNSARKEGFKRGAVIFLDQEEGGVMLPEQFAYIEAWSDAVRAAGFMPGVYCSGMPVQQKDAPAMTTAADLRAKLGASRQKFGWQTTNARLHPVAATTSQCRRLRPAARTTRWYGSSPSRRGVGSSPRAAPPAMPPMACATLRDCPRRRILLSTSTPRPRRTHRMGGSARADRNPCTRCLGCHSERPKRAKLRL